MNYLRTVIFALVVVLGLSPAIAQNFQANPAHTQILFRANHLNNVSYTFGWFNEIEASLNYDEAAVENSSIEFIVLTESIDTGIDLPNVEFDGERRDGHLRSPDFFDAAQFPTISFTSTSVAATDDPNMLEVTGDLNLHGVTNEITIMVEKLGEAVDQRGNQVVGFYSEFTIDRTDYGMSNLLESAGADILLMVSLEGTLQ